MKPSLSVFNPNGDMDLILRQSRAQRIQKATHGSSSSDGANEEPSGDTTVMEDQVELKQGPPVKFKNISSSVQTVEDLRNLGSRNELGQHIELRYRVSSAHLALASPVFKAMVDKSSATIDLSSRSKSGFIRYAEALLILLDVIHGHHKSVPQAMSLELLIELWRLIDSHKCHEAVEMFANHWVGSVVDKDKINGSSLKINMSRLYISWVFGQGEYFDLLARNILEFTAGSMQTNLPLPARILEALEHRREAIVNQVLDRIYGLLEELWSGECTRENCYARALGTLMKSMRSFGLEIPRSTNRPSNGKNILQLYDFTTRIKLRSNQKWDDCKWIMLNEHWDDCGLERLEKRMQRWEKEMSQIDICDGVRFRDFEVAQSTQEGNKSSHKRKGEASTITTNTRPLAASTGMKPSLLVFAPKGDTDIFLRKPNFRSHQKSLLQAADPNTGAEENDEHAEQELQDDQNEPQLPVVEEFNDVTA
ncbi:hypothetical protein FPHYL_9663 [Fusarium phyllophilum]|uniref:BTB domain-containing protein n=1 Tax=Fusarium phyllophilum TaxID=47803 RepID=A0A8H5N0T8_9HYPO|nr:hypothetical protein FPHYL_9663 [Fusarium phyllophilum]